MSQLAKTWIVAALAFALLSGAASAEDEEVLANIAFGSCARENRPQPIWRTILKAKPQMFLMIGDNIYGDTEDMEVLLAKYRRLSEQPGFEELRASCKFLAVWDDHDYGVNDGGKEYARKHESQRVFNQFFKTPADSPRRKRPGVYDAHIYGPEGRRVQVILLDTRFFRTSLKRWPPGERPVRGPYMPNDDPDAEILGEAQWKWLEEELKKPAELRILASSIQVLPMEHGWECWANFPVERKRLLDLLAETKANGVVMISGDRHLAEISRMKAKDGPLDYPLFEVTSSSLNQPGQPREEPNKHRLGEQFPGENFGVFEIDWEAETPTLTMAIRNMDSETVLSQKVKFPDLQP